MRFKQKSFQWVKQRGSLMVELLCSKVTRGNSWWNLTFQSVWENFLEWKQSERVFFLLLSLWLLSLNDFGMLISTISVLYCMKFFWVNVLIIYFTGFFLRPLITYRCSKLNYVYIFAGYLEVIITSSCNRGDQLGHLFWEDKLHYS